MLKLISSFLFFKLFANEKKKEIQLRRPILYTILNNYLTKKM